MWYAWVPEAKKYKLGIVNNNNNIEERLSTFTITLFDLSLLKKKKKVFNFKMSLPDVFEIYY